MSSTIPVVETRRPADAERKSERTALYRLHDEDAQLLYVGVTNDPKARFRQHARDKPWWPRVSTREIEWFDTREEALRVESQAIIRELPRHNDAGVQWPHHRLGEAPARVMHTSDFKMDPQACFDQIAETQQPVVVTRYGVPQVVIVPYFDRQAEEPKTD
ncbi:GIY-YIG nuclease family protein [Streptomyces sp. NBC_00669]|uniref:GIY-YIG nuclease family protein n=1 Tax=Streptomyces sp. NBC_00669 TaxID=2976011 RepID=UPI002E3619D3|nr:GIY-YIG nuclease family protein [Streptomyces sp. NBC_00669]